MTDALDAVQEAKRITHDLVGLMGIPSVVTAREEDDGSVKVTIHAHQGGLLIGRHGATLDALQLVVGLILNRGRSDKVRVVVDAEGYRNRRRDSLRSEARRVAREVAETGEAMEVETHSSYERRLVHMELADVPGVITRSEGEGRERRLMVFPEPGDR